MANGTIAADGRYGGDTTVHGGSSHLRDNGGFDGNLCGDGGGSDLETAGSRYPTARGTAPPWAP